MDTNPYGGRKTHMVVANPDGGRKTHMVDAKPIWWTKSQTVDKKPTSDSFGNQTCSNGFNSFSMTYGRSIQGPYTYLGST